VQRIDRTNAARALAKAMAYRDCGKDREAEYWAIALMRELQATGVIRPDVLARYKG
jgi:hypothetical protein